eukprot:8359379-Prorocentrum_lima.AAC.1
MAAEAGGAGVGTDAESCAGSCATVTIASCTTCAISVCMRSWASSNICWSAEARGSLRICNCRWRAAVASGARGTAGSGNSSDDAE